MEATTQMNIRIPQGLKKAGDEALAQIGLTPTLAVRALWEKAAQRGENLQEIVQLLTPTKTSEPESTTLQDGWSITQRFLAQYGQASQATPTDDELLEDYWLERLEERGLA